MISIIATLLLVFVAYISFSEGNMQTAWICIGLIGVVWLCFASTMKDIRAWRNRRDYWANGGPNGERKAEHSERKPVKSVGEKPAPKRKWLNDAP